MISPVLNQVSLSATELRLGNVVMHDGDQYIVNGISGASIEVYPLTGGLCTIVPISELYGHRLIQGYGDTYIVDVMLKNGFVRVSDITYYKDFPTGTIDIRVSHLKDCWLINDRHVAYNLHDLQNIHYYLFNQELNIQKL